MNITVNPWQKFIGLLPGGARTVAVVTQVNTNGTALVELQNDDVILVKGSGYSVDDQVLIVDGEIRGVVPSLPTTSIDLF